MSRPVLHCLALLALLSLGLPRPSWAQAAPDAGATTPAQGPSRPDAGADGETAPADGGHLRNDASGTDGPVAALDPARWPAQQVEHLKQQVDRLSREITSLRGVSGIELPAPVAKLFPVDLDGDPAAVDKYIKALAGRSRTLAAQAAESKERLAMLRPALTRQIAPLARAERRRRANPRRKIPAQVAERGKRARERLALIELEHRALRRRLDWVALQAQYLRATQAARVAAFDQRRAETTARSARETEASQRAKSSAIQTERSAEAAQKAALEQQRRARSEAERLLAGERARLEGVRLQQAKHEQHLALQLGALSKLRLRLERFRGGLSAKAETLLRRWPATAPQFNALYETVVAELVKLRPRAVGDLWKAIRGVDAAPAPGELTDRVRRLRGYDARLDKLNNLRARLEKRAEQLEDRHRALVDKRLALLQSEVTWLNDHRTTLLARVTPRKHASLTGLNRTTVEQLLREVSQLVFDAVYWSQKRLRQIDEVPALIVDIFTVGTLLWRTLQIILLLLLLRFVLRRWDGWMQAAIPRISRSGTLGSNALRAAKLAEAARHAGPALLVLILAVVIYRMLGGAHAATEFTVVYVIFFWVALYRLQLRLVETLARFVGMERALEMVKSGQDGLELERLPVDQEGPPAPRRRSTSEQRAVAAPMVAAPVLAVRTVRAATRYVLAVLLVLELTAIAVGEGTIYGLTVKFSWWAALPFVFRFLKLWQPHILEAYLRLTDAREDGKLAGLVQRSAGRFYEVVFVAAAFAVVFADRAARFGRRYLLNMDATKRLLAFLFRRQVAKHAKEAGRVLAERHTLPRGLLEQFPEGPIDRKHGALIPPVMEPLKQIFSTWQQRQADGSVALIGAAGMGKSTVLRLLEDQLGVPVLAAEPPTKLIRPAEVVDWIGQVFGFEPRPSSEDELVRMIREDTRPLVALDNCHHLFLRHVGGFEGWKSFVRVVNATCDNVFWLLTFNHAAWDYLYNAGGHEELFRRTLRIVPWTERWLQRLIMYRMTRAGYRVSFSDLIITHLPDLDLSQQAGRTSSGYFRMLWDFTGGNPRLAGHFWLDSLVPDPQTREVRVNLFTEPNIGTLEALPPNFAFVLTAIAEHESLTVDEAARTTRLSRDFCGYAFKSGVEDALLEPTANGRVRLSVRWQRPITRFLKRKHLLHAGQ